MIGIEITMNSSNVTMTGISLNSLDPFEFPLWIAEQYFTSITWYNTEDYLGVVRPCYKLFVREHMALDRVDASKWPYDNYEFI